MGCYECDKAKAAKDTKKAEQRAKIIEQLAEKFKDSATKTVAIVRTKNGFLSWREAGHESLNRLEVLEYLFLVYGVAP